MYNPNIAILSHREGIDRGCSMFKRFAFAVLTLCLLVLMSCNQAPPGTTPESGKSAPGSSGGGTEAAKAEAEPLKPLILAANTPISIRLIDALNSAKNRPGDSFQASLDEDLVVDGKVAFPKNSTVHGKVTKAVPSGHLKTPAELAITLTGISAKDKSVAIETNTLAEKAKSHTERNAKMVGGGAGVGALIGAIAGKGKGAAIGAGVGAGAGTAAAYGTGKKDIGYAPEARLTFRLRKEVAIQQ